MSDPNRPAMPFTGQPSPNRLNLVVLDGGPIPEDDYPQLLGDVLRDVRRYLGRIQRQRITLDDAAGWMEIDAGTLGRWERGENVPKPENLAKIAAAYRIPRSWWWILLEPGDFTPNLLREVWTTPSTDANGSSGKDELAASGSSRA